MKTFAIGELSRQAAVKVPTIRFYEERGLLPRAARTEGNRRTYDPADVRRLRFIRHARELGFEIEDIRALLDLAEQPTVRAAKSMRSLGAISPTLTTGSRV